MGAGRQCGDDLRRSPSRKIRSARRASRRRSPSSTLEPLFKAWGVKFDTAHAVGDPVYALQTERDVGGRPVQAQNLPWLALRGDALSHDEAILAQLSAIVMTTAGAFETSKDGVTLRPLLQASSSAVLLDAALAGDHSADPRRLMVGFSGLPSRRCSPPGCPERSTAPIRTGRRRTRRRRDGQAGGRKAGGRRRPRRRSNAPPSPSTSSWWAMPTC